MAESLFGAAHQNAGGTFRAPRSFMFEDERAFENAPSIHHEVVMLNLVVTLLIIALIAAVLGFGGIAMAAVGIAKLVFFVALVLFLVALVAGAARGPVL
jgi:uncharacterized membrane protein YtjA (UPF0391 family)